MLAIAFATVAALELLALVWYVRDDLRRRSLNGNVAPHFEHLKQFPEVAKEVTRAVDLSIAAVVKQSIRSRTVAGITYREGAFDALSVLRRTLNGGK